MSDEGKSAPERIWLHLPDGAINSRASVFAHKHFDDDIEYVRATPDEAAQPDESVLHWRFVAGATATSCGRTAEGLRTSLLTDFVNCPDCDNAIAGYRHGRTAAVSAPDEPAAPQGDRVLLLLVEKLARQAIDEPTQATRNLGTIEVLARDGANEILRARAVAAPDDPLSAARRKAFDDAIQIAGTVLTESSVSGHELRIDVIRALEAMRDMEGTR